MRGILKQLASPSIISTPHQSKEERRRRREEEEQFILVKPELKV
jgi:hypothetical protein